MVCVNGEFLGSETGADKQTYSACRKQKVLQLTQECFFHWRRLAFPSPNGRDSRPQTMGRELEGIQFWDERSKV
jgi:hypothetical protein